MTNKLPLVYIVLPVYNGEKYFLEQLISIYHQNYKNWFLIIINDGSTDNSENIGRDWISHYNLYDKVKVINKENGGVNSAVQRGLEEIKNMCDIYNTDSLVSYCDADDIRTREKLSIQVKYMVEHPECGLSYHDLYIIDNNGFFLNNSRLKYYRSNDSFLYISTVGGDITSTEIMFRVSYIEKIIPMPIGHGIYQDYRTILVFSLLNLGIKFIDTPLAYLRRGHKSLSTQNYKEYWKNRQYYYSYLQERFSYIDLSYIIKCNQDWMINWRRNGRNIPYILMRLSIKYPDVFFLCLRMIYHKIKTFIINF